MRTLLVLITLCFSFTAHALETTFCSSFQSLPSGKFCVSKESLSRNPDLLIYLHGGGGDEATWFDERFYTQQIRDFWAEKKLQQPTVVSITFGELWLFVEKNSSDKSGLFEAFIDKALPEIEQAIGGLKGRRILLGESMGGFNATQLALKTKLFKKAALICTPMAELSPYASELDIRVFVELSNAWSYYKKNAPKEVLERVTEMLQIIRAFYPTPNDWAKGDPLELVKHADFSNLEGLYVNAGFYDPYVLFEGNQAFVKVLKVRQAPVQWHPQWGGHCAIDIPSLARFLVE